MDVIGVQRQYERDKKKTLIVYNPLLHDVEWKYDGKPQDPIPSKENIRLQYHLAKLVGSKIVDLYLATKNKNYPREKAERLVFA